MKIKKGDKVKIISGKDRGKTGKVLSCLPKLNKIVVERLNLVKKHQRPRREGEKGQIIEVSRPINVSKVRLVCPKCNHPTRIGYKLTEGEKVRICKKCQSEL